MDAILIAVRKELTVNGEKIPLRVLSTSTFQLSYVSSRVALLIDLSINGRVIF